MVTIGVWTADKLMGLQVTWWACIGLVLLAAMFGGLNALLNRSYSITDGLVVGVVGRMGSGKSLLVVQRVLLPFCRQLSKNGGSVRSATGRPVRRVVTNFRFNPQLPNVEVRAVKPTRDVDIFEQLILLAHQIGTVEGEGPWYDQAGVLHDGREPIPSAFELGLPCDDLTSPPAPVWLVEHEVMAFERQPILNALVILDEMHLFMSSSKVAPGEAAGYIISMARKLNCELWWVSQHENKIHKRLRDESSSIWLAGKMGGLVGLFIGSGWHMAREYLSPAQVEQARNTLGTDRAPKCYDKRIYRFTADVKRFYNSFELLVPDPPSSRRPSVAQGAVLRSGSIPVGNGAVSNDGAMLQGVDMTEPRRATGAPSSIGNRSAVSDDASAA